ncbi:MAG: hypothetical protein R2758_10790 [Bacteroidales bacterium]
MKKILTLIFVLVLTGSCSLWAQKKEAKKDAKSSESQVKPSVPSSFFSAITFRSVGPAWASGRIADLAVNPSNHSEIYMPLLREHMERASTTVPPGIRSSTNRVLMQ